MLSIISPSEMSMKLAKRFRELRLARALSREELASRSGVTIASIKRFELTGDISLHRLLILCFTLGILADFEQLLQAEQPLSMQALKKMVKTRQRGRRKST